MTVEDPDAMKAGPARVPRFGLSGKLLVLTVLFVMIAEVLIYVPLVANFRLNWLQDRLAGAYTGALVLKAAGENLPESVRGEILSSVRAKAVAMFMAGIPVSNLIGSPISGLLLGVHWFNQPGWRWLFIVEGIPAVILGVVVAPRSALARVL